MWCFGWLVRPRLPDDLKQPTADEVREAVTARDDILPLDNPLRIHRKVDYAEGTSASWWPKGESPILGELVAEGELPPVAERVGPEPLVYEGVDGIGKYGGTWVRVAGGDMTRLYLTYEMGCATLNRWTPYGDTLVPHLATRIDVSDDNDEAVQCPGERAAFQICGHPKYARRSHARALDAAHLPQPRSVCAGAQSLLLCRRLHWYSAGCSEFVIQPSLNRLILPDKPATAKKAKLLADARFRKALSYALDREAIIDAVWHGVASPSQVAPGKASVYYYPKLNHACIEYDPQRAKRLLDELGLATRDS